MRDPRPDLGIPEDRQRIFAHLGVVVSLASVIDARMLQIGAWLVNPDDQQAVRREWVKKNRTALARRRALHQAMPYGWQQGAQLLEATGRAFAHRNTMGHGSLDFKIAGPPDYAVSWSWLTIHEKTGEIEVVPIDLSEFEVLEFRFTVIEEALKFIVGPARHFAKDKNDALPTIDLKQVCATSLPISGR
jgi:hypothetical protein